MSSPDDMMAQAKAGIALYHERVKLWTLTCRLPLRDIRRLNELLAKLSDDDLRQIAVYAEGLAEWDAIAHASSGDANADRPPEGAAEEDPTTNRSVG